MFVFQRQEMGSMIDENGAGRKFCRAPGFRNMFAGYIEMVFGAQNMGTRLREN